MLKLCLFDLDETLLQTEDLTEIREAGKYDGSREYKEKLLEEIKSDDNRHLYSQGILKKLRSDFPAMKIGIFTRAPRSYAETILEWAYPDFEWDTIIAYEDVKKRKPYGEGIIAAMDQFNLELLDEVILIGDSDLDIRAAYNAGCLIAIDKSNWPYKFTPDNWKAIKHLPDAIIGHPKEIFDVIANPFSYTPELERLLAAAPLTTRIRRFEKVHHYHSVEKKSIPIHIAGRSFSGYESLSERRKWHALSQSIVDCKDAEEFPESWKDVFFSFLSFKFPLLQFSGKLIITTIPHRPEREPRLEAFLAQLEKSSEADEYADGRLTFVPDLLAYKPGVQSNSRDFLSSEDRLKNVSEHLFVKRPRLSDGKLVLVLDDVTTTGASLMTAKLKLEEAGSAEVTCLSIAQSISKVV